MGQKHEVFCMTVEGDLSSRVIKNGQQFVTISYGATYSIRMSNGSPSRCDVKLELDEVLIGTWRLESREVLILEGHPYSCSPFRMSTGGEILKAIFYPERSSNVGSPKSVSPTRGDSSLKMKFGEITKVPSLSGAQIDTANVTEVRLKLLLG